jgi:hypothetical protein
MGGGRSKRMEGVGESTRKRPVNQNRQREYESSKNWSLKTHHCPSESEVSYSSFPQIPHSLLIFLCSTQLLSYYPTSLTAVLFYIYYHML